MLANEIRSLKSLIQVLGDGWAFYCRAADQAELAKHREIFACMAKAREFAVSYLQPLIYQPEKSSTETHAFGSVLHKMYPDILFDLDERFDKALLEQCHKVEEQTHEAMLATVKQAQSPHLEAILLDLYPRLNRNAGAHRRFERTG